ncbi:MAG TPA: 4Fe-4S binding protein [Candidatus Bathyarchaeia archaeon]
MVVDAGKCDGCGKCVAICPQQALEMTLMLIDLDDETVAAVTEAHRKKIKYTCSSCKPESGKSPCVLICPKGAIECVWNPV